MAGSGCPPDRRGMEVLFVLALSKPVVDCIPETLAGRNGRTSDPRSPMISRRHVLSATLALGIGVLAAGAASAQTYPDKIIKMIVPAPAGGQTDVLARYMAQRLQEALGQNVMVEKPARAGG